MQGRTVTEDELVELRDRIATVLFWGVPNTMTIHAVREMTGQIARQVEQLWSRLIEAEQPKETP
jgi:hypothetical protein